MGQAHGLVLIAMGIIAPKEADGFFINGDDAVVVNGYPVGIAPQIVE